MIKFNLTGKSAKLDLSGTCEIAIGASFMESTILAMVLVVSNSLTTVAAGLEPETNIEICQRFNNE